ncbi:MAG TPA: 50S ribosomal protein L17 [Myxococcota bacterium]|nr:50S ribosomal protein L17 [Myxococcota bacterium]
MPHQIHQRKFGRKSDLRRSLLRNLTLSVLRYERVKTTEAKAKEIRGFVDRMINLGKDGSLEARRKATAWLPEPVIVEKLFSDLAKRYPDRSSGFLRITRLARRVGDNSKLMLVELMPGVDEAAAAPAADEKPRRRRLSLPRRGGGNNPKATPAEEPATAKTAASTSKVKKASTATPKKKAPARATSRGAKASSSKEA